MSKYELIKRVDGSVCKAGSLDEQFELLKKFGLPPTAAETQRVKVTVVDGKNRYTLVKREQPISIFLDDHGHAQSVARTSKTGADNAGFNVKRGKYNDEGRLSDAQLYGGRRSIGDVEAWNAN